MAAIFKVIKNHERVDVPGSAVPELTALLDVLFPDATAGNALQLHFNRKNPTPQNPKGEGITAALSEVVGLTEQELRDAITAGEMPNVHAIEDV